MTRFEITLSGLFLLALISYLITFSSHTDSPKPVAAARSPQVSIEPQREKHDLPRPKRRARVSGSSVPANPVAIAQDAVSSEENDTANLGEASIPLVFVDPPPELTSSEEQLAEIDFLRQQFIELMGGPDQDPATPEYRRRWDEAQRQIDDQFAAFFGQEAFNQQQVKAVREAGQPSGRL